jgi:hypothetical protein
VLYVDMLVINTGTCNAGRHSSTPWWLHPHHNHPSSFHAENVTRLLDVHTPAPFTCKCHQLARKRIAGTCLLCVLVSSLFTVCMRSTVPRPVLRQDNWVNCRLRYELEIILAGVMFLASPPPRGQFLSSGISAIYQSLMVTTMTVFLKL